MPIRDLAAHPAHYVTVADLAEYWAVSRQQIYKRIESGALAAVRFGSRLYRVRTSAALEYERGASVMAVADKGINSPAKTSPTLRNRLPAKIGPQRVIRKFRSE